jgi:hypothetical protein
MASSAQIIPYYAHPHVHTAIFDHTWYEETVAEPRDPDDLPFSTCIVTGADMGIDNTFVRLSSLRTKIALFGRGNYAKYGQASIQADELFNSGQMNVWFYRALPDNATYSNIIVIAKFRVGKILDELSQETGKVRLEVKYSIASAAKPSTTTGAVKDSDIEEYAQSLTKLTPDPLTGYMSIPLFYVRSIGRGKYGDKFSIRMTRDTEAEKEYGIKMNRYSLLSNDVKTRVTNMFVGSMYQTTRYEMSTLIEDVLDQFPTGSCPISIHTFEDNFIYLHKFYMDQVVGPNETYLLSSDYTDEEMADLMYAKSIAVEQFDPLFGLRMNTRTDDLIPYYRNYTIKPTGPWVVPDLTVPDVGGATKPLNITDWSTAKVGARVLVISDPINNGLRWIYNVIDIDSNTGDITYDEGYQVQIDDDQYDGINLQLPVGNRFTGGHDGDFQEISVGGVSRPPTVAEMKILLSREYVRAFRGERDRKILSPARINLDFIFDANYNLTAEAGLSLDSTWAPIFNNSTVLTDKDYQQLAILGTDNFLVDFTDLNVKQAIYDLNEFRNRNGMTIDYAEGAGCYLYLDCNLTGLKSVGINSELIDILSMMEPFQGRNCGIDLGYYDIYDPTTGKRISVTATYFIAANLINHILKEGLNKPFVYTYATLRAITRNSRSSVVTGNMIRDSFRPDIDLIDWDVKERLFNARINYYLTEDEGRQVQRAVQNTRQLDASSLLEENNVRVLNTLKKGLEKACRSYLYNWNEPEVRRGYTDAQMDIYRPWIGSMVHDLQIIFTANEWEQERMIMRCLVYVAFRDIIKRIVLEINVLRPDYESGGMKTYDYGAAKAEAKYGTTFEREEGGN